MATKFVASTKVTKATKSKIKNKLQNDYFFSRAKQFWVEEQAKNKARNKWFGQISPSAQLNFDMCIEEFFQEQVHEFLEFKEDTLYSVRTGGMIHEGFVRTFQRIPGFRFGEPYYSDSRLKDWYEEKVRPEYPVWCKETGIKGKIDYVIEKEGRPAIVDLKNTWVEQKYWRGTVLPQIQEIGKISEIIQLCIYADRLNHSEAFPLKVHDVALAYVNWFEKPFSRYWGTMIWIDYWNDYRKKTRNLVKSLADGWHQSKESNRIRCNNIYCTTHGSKRA